MLYIGYCQLFVTITDLHMINLIKNNLISELINLINKR